MHAEGRAEGLTEAARQMKEKGFSEAAISNAINIDLQPIHQWVIESSADMEDPLD